MTQAIVNQGVKYVKSGMNPVSLREGIQRASQMVCDKIPELARKVESVADLVNIATVSTGGEKEMAQTIATVFERVGMDAKVGGRVGVGLYLIPWGKLIDVPVSTTILPKLNPPPPKQLGGATLLEDGNKLEDELDISSGMRLDRSGFDSPYYITDMDRLVCELKRPRVLVTNYALIYSYQLVPILEEIVSRCVGTEMHARHQPGTGSTHPRTDRLIRHRPQPTNPIPTPPGQDPRAAPHRGGGVQGRGALPPRR